MNEVEIIRKNLKEMLLQRDINQSNLSNISGVSQPTISRFLKGSNDIKLTTLVSLLNSLNLSISDILLSDITTACLTSTIFSNQRQLKFPDYHYYNKCLIA